MPQFSPKFTFLVVGQVQIGEKSNDFLQNRDFWWVDEIGQGEIEEKPPDFPRN